MKHLSESTLSAFADGALDSVGRSAAERHLAECDACRAALAAIEADGRALAAALVHDPGEEYFASFAERVQERIRGQATGAREADTGVAAAKAPRPARAAAARESSESPLATLARWLTGPRVAWVGAAAAVVAVAGLVVVLARERPLETLRKDSIAGRADQVAKEEVRPAPAREAPSAQDGVRQVDRFRGESDERAQSFMFSEPGAPTQDAGVAELKPAELEGPAGAAPGPSPGTAATPPDAAKPAAEAGAKPEAAPGSASEMRRGQGEDIPVRDTREALGPAAQIAPPGVPKARLVKPPPRPLAGEPAAPAPLAESAGTFAATPLAEGSRGDERAGAPAGQVCGVVSDTQGRPLAGAQVALADLAVVAVTGADGRYCIEGPAGEHTLSVMAIGFAEARAAVSIGAGRSERDVTLSAVPVLKPDSAWVAPAAPKPRPPFPWPPSARTLAAMAERAMREAQRSKTAADYDGAARQWERVAAIEREGPAAVEARRQLSEARFRAWQTAPTRQRAVNALSALGAYLRLAPAGPDRDLARRRLQQLQRQ